MATKASEEKYLEILSILKGSDTFISFDLETTGIGNPENFPYLKIIEIGAVKVENGEVVDRFQTFVNPNISIPKKVVELTGITDEMVKEAPCFATALKNFKNFVKDYTLVAHNAQFDSSFIYYFGDLIGINFRENPLVDSLRIAKKLFPKEENKLGLLAERLGVLQIDEHRADDDAEVLAQIMLEMMPMLEDGMKNAPVFDRSTLKTNLPDFADCDYQICSANYWEGYGKKRIYVTMKTGFDYYDFFYDLDNHYWSFKEKAQAKQSKINFAALNKKFKDYVHDKKPVLKPYLQLL